MVDLSTEVALENLSAAEINIILSEVAGGSTIRPENPNVVVYGGNIEVKYKSNSRKILKILVTPSYWIENKSKIIETFVIANNPSSEMIYSRVVFSAGRELQIAPFKWKDEFQLGRLPEGNSKPEESYSLYPCLFQFKVPQTGNLFLDNHRSGEAFKKRFLPLIPLLIQYYMTHLQYDAKTSSRKEWALTVTEEGFENKWLQLGYFIKSSLSTDIFYNYKQPEVKQLPVCQDDFYSHSFLNLSIGYDTYEHLSEIDREKFLLGCEWFNKAVTAHERTDSFLFIMIMLEIFLPKDSIKCDECKQDMYSINKKFKTYIPEVIGEKWTENFEKVLGNLYSLRSNVAHNGVAIAEYSLGLMPLRWKEENQLRYAFDLARQFLVSWLGKKYEEQKEASSNQK